MQNGEVVIICSMQILQVMWRVLDSIVVITDGKGGTSNVPNGVINDEMTNF